MMANNNPIRIFINKTKYELDNPVQTGASLKQLANIKPEDVLFLQAHGEDQVIANDGDAQERRPPPQPAAGRLRLLR
jgi:hypothetical protein